jgi:hypothetical protein
MDSGSTSGLPPAPVAAPGAAGGTEGAAPGMEPGGGANGRRIALASGQGEVVGGAARAARRGVGR